MCHAKLDPFGFALEGFDAIGRKRDKDLGDRPIDTAADLPDGTHVDGLAGLRSYLVTQRKDQFLRYFCRKLLGYSLGRGVQLSDQLLVEDARAIGAARLPLLGRGRDDCPQSTVPLSPRRGGRRHYRGNRGHRRRQLIQSSPFKCRACSALVTNRFP